MLSWESSINTCTPRFIITGLFTELDWFPLTGFTMTAFAPIVRMFYLNIIEYDLDESYLKSSLFGIVVKVTPKVVVEVLGITLVKAPFMSELEITSELLDRVFIGNHPLTYSVYPSSHRAYI